MTKYYYTMVSDFRWEQSNGYNPRWRSADSLTEALIQGRDLFNRMDSEDKQETTVRIQTRAVEHVGERIPAYMIGDIIYRNRNFLFIKYTAKTFNARKYCDTYKLAKDGKLTLIG